MAVESVGVGSLLPVRLDRYEPNLSNTDTTTERQNDRTTKGMSMVAATKKSLPRSPSVAPHPKHYTKVRAGDVMVDGSVQRLYDPVLANKLEASWDDMYAGTIVISKRKDGSLYCIDGQHRLAVVKRKRGDSALLDAEVHEGLSIREEALMFLKYNRERKNVKPFDNYSVALTAGLPLEVRVDHEVRVCNLEVAPSPSANKIGAVQSLLRLAEKDVDGGVLTETLSTLESAFGRAPETWDGMLLQAVGNLIIKNRGKVDLKRLSSTLRKNPVGVWKAHAVTMAVGGGGSVSRSNYLSNIIATNYNMRSRTAPKLIW